MFGKQIYSFAIIIIKVSDYEICLHILYKIYNSCNEKKTLRKNVYSE